MQVGILMPTRYCLIDSGCLEKYMGPTGVANLHRTLKDIFGFNQFREGQRVSGKNSVALGNFKVIPTSGGDCGCDVQL